MSPSASLTVASDRDREMPDPVAARLDRVRSALASLRDEERRLERLGFERPLARCHEERRYWRFLEGILGAACEERTPNWIGRIGA